VTFAAQVLPYRGELLSAARRKTFNRADAEDLVQETIAKALDAQQRGLYREDGNTRAWLYRILETTFLKRCYEAKRFRDKRVDIVRAFDCYERFDRFDVVVCPNPEAEISSEVNEALLQLPDEQYEVVVRSDIGGQSYKAIAAALSIPMGTVMSRLNRGRRRLQQLLGDYATENYGLGRARG
jgi:RNA polymerase sigma-70 factor, ECF subfamily